PGEDTANCRTTENHIGNTHLTKNRGAKRAVGQAGIIATVQQEARASGCILPAHIASIGFPSGLLWNCKANISSSA
ncbi:hypothetical protein NLR33_25175, partial [Escherichia coli]|nr:hypothetical protein [Escherichia coli]